MLKKMIPFLVFFGILGGCSLHSGSTYESGEMGAPAYFKKGVILSVRDIKIKGRESGVGAIAGATAGGLAGSTLGDNTATKVLGGLGGAVIGGIVGNTAENLITGGNASEFIIQPDEGDPYSLVQVNDEHLKVGERVLIMESGKLRIVRDNTTAK
ncbi:MAG: glycine zipper 2TM domain-containing protein [Nitrospinota bacterium]|nr:glycine zipper 2TM domain-containing protein [Nitrospinota bacterium]MEC9423652.1 glycine zipper 2TM domain-containing protein [Nitrospinota bacterium]MEE3253631.1 glycine zipper 2TM domain-containing protein [Nitrospinota bacterium]